MFSRLAFGASSLLLILIVSGFIANNDEVEGASLALSPGSLKELAVKNGRFSKKVKLLLKHKLSASFSIFLREIELHS